MRERYIERLLEEWKQHGKIIIAVDYDDTIRDWRMKSHELYRRVIKLVKDCQATGAYVVLFSACTQERYPEMKEYCSVHGLHIDAINENPIKLPYGNHSKIYANIFLDDRGGLEEAMSILETTLYKYRGFIEEGKIKQLGDIA